MRRWRKAACPRVSAPRSARTTRPAGLNREVACHYTFMHENLFDMNHQFMHRKQMGSIRARCLGRDHGDDWAQVEYSFSRTEGKSSVGEQVIVDLMRKRGEAKKDFSDHMRIRTDYPTQSLKVWVGRDIQAVPRPGARCVAGLHAARRRAAHQPHLRLSVGEKAAHAGHHSRGVALRDLVYREYFPRGQGNRGVRAAGPTMRRVRTGTTRCFRRSAICEAYWPAAAGPSTRSCSAPEHSIRLCARGSASLGCAAGAARWSRRSKTPGSRPII